MPWLDGLKGIAEIAEMRSFNWIAQEAKTKPANGKKLETCNLLDMGTCLLHYQNLMMSVEHSATTTNSPKTNRRKKNILIYISFDHSL